MLPPDDPHLDERQRADRRPHVVHERQRVSSVLVRDVREREHDHHRGEERQREGEGDEVEGHRARDVEEGRLR
eukprot:31175-Pelagococcus_subviridis.AAC.1